MWYQNYNDAFSLIDLKSNNIIGEQITITLEFKVLKDMYLLSFGRTCNDIMTHVPFNWCLQFDFMLCCNTVTLSRKEKSLESRTYFTIPVTFYMLLFQIKVTVVYRYSNLVNQLGRKQIKATNKNWANLGACYPKLSLVDFSPYCFRQLLRCKSVCYCSKVSIGMSYVHWLWPNSDLYLFTSLFFVILYRKTNLWMENKQNKTKRQRKNLNK